MCHRELLGRVWRPVSAHRDTSVRQAFAHSSAATLLRQPLRVAAVAYSYPARMTLDILGGGTIVLDPIHEQTITTDLKPVKVKGHGMYLCASTGQAVKCVEVTKKKLSWLKSLPAKQVTKQGDGTPIGTHATDVTTANIINALSQRFPDVPNLLDISEIAMHAEKEAHRLGDTNYIIDPVIVLNVQKAFRADADEVLDRLTKAHHLDDSIDMSAPPATHQKTYQSVRAQIEHLTRQVASSFGSESEELECCLNDLSSAAGSSTCLTCMFYTHTHNVGFMFLELVCRYACMHACMYTHTHA